MFKKTKAWFIELADDLVFLGKKTGRESKQFGRYMVRLTDAKIHNRPFINKIVPLDVTHVKAFCSPSVQPKVLYGPAFAPAGNHLDLTSPRNYWMYNPFGSPAHPTYNNDHGMGRF